jgi:hypothetical protein
MRKPLATEMAPTTASIFRTLIATDTAGCFSLAMKSLMSSIERRT